MKKALIISFCLAFLAIGAQNSFAKTANEPVTMEKACVNQVARGETLDGIINGKEADYWLLTTDYDFENANEIYDKLFAACACNKNAQCTIKFTTNDSLVKKVISYKKTK